MEFNLESLGSVAGGALPIPFGGEAGKLAGSLLSKLSGLGKKTNATTQSADINKIADLNRLTGEQAGAVVAAHCAISSDRFDDLAAYCAKNNDRFLGLLAEYNNSHPGTKIQPGNEFWQATQYTPSAEMYEQTPVQLVPASQRLLGASTTVQQQLRPPTSMQRDLTSQEVRDIASSGLDGLRKGVTDGIMKTKEGKAAQNAGAKQWLNDNGLVIGAILAVLLSAFTYLLSTRKK